MGCNSGKISKVEQSDAQLDLVPLIIPLKFGLNQTSSFLSCVGILANGQTGQQ